MFWNFNIYSVFVKIKKQSYDIRILLVRMAILCLKKVLGNLHEKLIWMVYGNSAANITYILNLSYSFLGLFLGLSFCFLLCWPSYFISFAWLLLIIGVSFLPFSFRYNAVVLVSLF